MKVIVDIQSTDESGEVIKTTANAMLEERKHDYKITFVERMSDSDIKTKTTMLINERNVRIIREGEINSDFMYAKELVHNSLYKTPYGELPVTVTTKSFNFMGSRTEPSGELFESFPGVKSNAYKMNMHIDIEYELAMEGAKPLDMSVSIEVGN